MEFRKKLTIVKRPFMMVNMYSPDEIKQLRTESGMTMAAFGLAVGVSESTICYWESGRSHPRYEMILKLNIFAEKLRGGKKKLASAV